MNFSGRSVCVVVAIDAAARESGIMHKLVFVELFSRDTAIVLQLLRLSNH